MGQGIIFLKDNKNLLEINFISMKNTSTFNFCLTLTYLEENIVNLHSLILDLANCSLGALTSPIADLIIAKAPKLNLIQVVVGKTVADSLSVLELTDAVIRKKGFFPKFFISGGVLTLSSINTIFSGDSQGRIQVYPAFLHFLKRNPQALNKKIIQLNL